MESGQNLVTPSDRPLTLVERVKDLRFSFDYWEKKVRELMSHADFQSEMATGQDFGEAKANIMLAFRSIEDCRMRLGKVIQAMTGGVSIYDTPTQPTVAPN